MFKFSKDESKNVIAYLSVLSALGYTTILFIDNYYIALAACALLVSTVLNQTMCMVQVIESINDIASKKDYPSVYSGADLSKMTISLILAGIMAVAISQLGLKYALYIPIILHVILAIAYYNPNIKMSPKTNSNDHVEDKGQILHALRWVVPISLSYMLLNCWISIVPVLTLLNEFKLDSTWVSILVFVQTLGYSIAFASPLIYKAIGFNRLFAVLLTLAVSGAVTINISSSPEIYIFGCFLLTMSIGGYFSANNVYINSVPGNTHQKLSIFFYTVNFFQPAVYLAIPFLIKFDLQETFLDFGILSLVIAILVFIRFNVVK